LRRFRIQDSSGRVWTCPRICDVVPAIVKQQAIATPPLTPDLEIKDAQLIFNRVWRELEAEIDRENLLFPKELILLGGAPGSGKGTNTAFICEVRGISAPPIVISELLDSPDAQAIKARGGMVGDEEVLRLLLRELLKPQFRDSAVLDGFPRTTVQVECLKMFYDQMVLLRREFSGTPRAHVFRQPVFHIMVLFVDEAESIVRQLKRGREAIAHNAEVRQSGVGKIEEERTTDFDPELARNRYRTFKEKTYDALVSLKQIFHYHFINAQAPVEVVQQNIISELEYQSSLELDPRTYDTLRHIPLADEIVQHARQELVNRLDSYQVEYPQELQDVVDFIQGKMMPIIKRYAVSGRVMINTEETLFQDPVAIAILIDIFSERGFRASVDIHHQEIPERFDLKTGEIHIRTKRVYRMTIFFNGSKIRRG
jgi:adenylate kinase